MFDILLNKHVFSLCLAYKDCDSSDDSDLKDDKGGDSSSESMESDESTEEDNIDFFGLNSKTEVTSRVFVFEILTTLFLILM